MAYLPGTSCILGKTVWCSVETSTDTRTQKRAVTFLFVCVFTYILE